MSVKSSQKSGPRPASAEEMLAALEPIVQDQSRTTLLFDLDGTLAPIVPRPDAVSVPSGVLRTIRKLSHIYLSVAIVSGRAANEARRIVGNSDIAYIGNHGFEVMLPGRPLVISEEAHPFLGSIRELAGQANGEEMADAGVWLEDKSATLTYHYRRARDPEAARAYIREHIEPAAEKLGLAVSEGRMVVEVRPPVKVNKGVSVRRLLDRLDARGALYAGDDNTDIDALKELRRWRRKKDHDAVGVGVISPEMPPRLPRFCDFMVLRTSGVEMLLQMLAGEEP